MGLSDWMIVGLALFVPLLWGWLVDWVFRQRGWSRPPRLEREDVDRGWHYQI